MKNNRLAFDEVKRRLVKPPIWYIYQTIMEGFIYISDTSKFAPGNTLYQIQNGKPKLIVYVSKRLPEVDKKLFYYRTRSVWFSYECQKFCASIEKSRFQCHSGSFSFDTCIIKSKEELTTTSIKRL